MKSTQTISSIIGDYTITTNCKQRKEHDEEFKGIPVVHNDHNCSIKGCNLDHKTLAFFLSLEIERFHCNEGYHDHKDDDSGGINISDDKEGNRLGSLINTDRLSNCGSISCRSSSRRSFTFPVLRSEWPDSPVRMVKADRRHRQRWRTCFICFKL